VALLVAGCPPSPRGRCSSDADCAAVPGLFCAEGVCQAPPRLSLEVPREAAARSETATVRARVARAHGGAPAVSLVAAGSPVPAVSEGGGTFRFEVPLSLAPAGAEGLLAFRVAALDDLGHETAIEDALAFDDAAPALSLPEPAWRPRAPLAVRATVRDAALDEASIGLTIGGLTLRPSSAAGDARIFDVPASAMPAGVEGPIEMLLQARDRFGHAASRAGQIWIDDRAPRVAIDPAAVPGGPVVRGTEVALAVSVEDASPVSVTWSVAGGAQVAAEALGGGKFVARVPTRFAAPAAASAEVTVTATDAVALTARAAATVSMTRVKWKALPRAAQVSGIALQQSSVMVASAGPVLGRIARSNGDSNVFDIAKPALSVTTSGLLSFVVRSDSTACLVDGAGALAWCCGPFATIDSAPALGHLPDPGDPLTLVVATNGTSTTGQRLYAITDGGTQCNWSASLQLAQFEQTGPAIAADGSIYLGAATAVVSARFDGLAWSAKPTPRPERYYRAPAALAGPATVLFASIGGVLESLVFGPADPQPAFSTDVTPGSLLDATGMTVARDGTLTAGADDRRIVALDPQGNVRWSAPLPGRPTAPPTHGADGTMYAVDDSGQVTALDAAGAVLWTFQASAPIRAAPALGCDGILYLGADDGAVLALVTESLGLADSPWPRAGHDSRNSADVRTPLRDAGGACVD